MNFGGVYVFKEKNIEKREGKEKGKEQKMNFFIEKKAYRDKFYLVA